MENLEQLKQELELLIGEEFERTMLEAIAERERKLEELARTVPMRLITYP